MKQKNKKLSSVLLAVLALVLIVSFNVNGAMAYFTTYATARGGHLITLGASSQIRERMVEWDKHIQIENVGDTVSYVRIKAFAGAIYELTFTDGSEGKWTMGDDGYWYYSEPLQPGETSGELVISIEIPEELATSFNVTVVQESTPVLYGEDDLPYADWTLEAEMTTDSQDIPVGEGGQDDE